MKVDGLIHLEKLDIQRNVKKAHNVIGYGGVYRRNENKIYINLGDIDKFTFKEDIINEICLIISHEYMHKLLFNTINSKACSNWDNIATNLEEYL